MKLTYSLVAREEYLEILYFLSDNYSEEAALKFEKDFLLNVKHLESFPESFPKFHDTSKRKFKVNKNVTVLFQINENESTVEILNFWFNRSNPDVLLQHL
jgi:plasmid stabilization system protein ParE